MGTAEALDVFDSLDPVDVAFMLGAWRGQGLATGHPLDGALEAFHWHGKRFDSAEDVFPLVFSTSSGHLVAVNPALLPLSQLSNPRAPRGERVGRLFQRLLPLFTTGNSSARLRMVDYRGRISATMIYDAWPVMDTFRRIDDQTVMGLMDLKGMAQPFFFLLRREPGVDE